MVSTPYYEGTNTDGEQPLGSFQGNK